MHHYRVTVNGPDAAAASLLAELAGVGAPPTMSSDAPCVVIASADGVPCWEELSRRHPDVRLSIEAFEALEDEIVNVVVENGASTLMARVGVLPAEFGAYHEEGGTPLDANLLRAAAERVADRRLHCKVGTLSSGLEVALSMGRELGLLCDRVESTALGDPPADAIDAVVELAAFALWVSASSRSLTRAECEFEHALRLTQSLVHAGRCELWDTPGDASWCEWLGVLIGGASDVVDAACLCDVGPESPTATVSSELHCTPGEGLELEARSLLTSCLQALVLFMAPPITVR
jgi:hypothetical protein